MPLVCFANKATDSLHQKAESCFETGDYDMMLEYTLHALALAENGSCEDKVYSYLRVGRAYYYLRQLSTSVRHMKQAINIGSGCGLDSLVSVAYRNTGSVYLEMSKPDSGIMYLRHAERMLLNTTRWGELSNLYAVMGEVQLYANPSLGKHYYDLASQYAVKSGDTLHIAFAIMKKGMYATITKDCATGEKYFRQALQLYRAKHQVEGEMYAIKTLAWATSQCGDAKGTYELFIAYHTLRDSIFKAETAEKTARYRTLYETEKKERENAELARQNTLKELQIAQEVKNRRILLAGFSIAVLFLIIIFLFVYSRYKLKKQKEADQHLAEQRQLSFSAVIEAEEKERKRIAGDLHDSVGQTMSAAKINLSVLQNEMEFTSDEQKNTFHKIVALVDESCREVRTVSHNMMPNALLKLGLATAIRNFISRIDSKVLSIDLYSDGLDNSLNANSEVVLYRVVQECVNNVIKHSGATHLHISLIKDEEGISVTIEDNGKGFDPAQMEGFDGIGLRNIRSRISYLKGTVEWDTSPGKGTAVTINIPA